MRKLGYVVATLMVLAVLLAGCTSNTQNTPPVSQKAETRVITDMAGRQVEIPVVIERTAFFGGPIGQVPYILGVEDTVVATSIGSKNSQLLNIMDPELKGVSAPRQTNGIINIEELIKSNPQFVIAGTVDGGIVEKQTTLPVVYFFDSSDGTAQQTKDEVTFIGYIYGKDERARLYGDYMDRMLALVRSRVADIPPGERKVLYNGYDPNQPHHLRRGHLHAGTDRDIWSEECSAGDQHFRSKTRNPCRS